LKIASFGWAILGEKEFAKKEKSESSSVATRATHYWPHIFSNAPLVFLFFLKLSSKKNLQIMSIIRLH